MVTQLRRESSPSYDDVVFGKSYQVTGLSASLRAMQPGDVLDVTDLTRSKYPAHSVRARAACIFGHRKAIATREINGRIYVARLRDEDAR